MNDRVQHCQLLRVRRSAGWADWSLPSAVQHPVTQPPRRLVQRTCRPLTDDPIPGRSAPLPGVRSREDFALHADFRPREPQVQRGRPYATRRWGRAVALALSEEPFELTQFIRRGSSAGSMTPDCTSARRRVVLIARNPGLGATVCVALGIRIVLLTILRGLVAQGRTSFGSHQTVAA